MQPLAPTTRAPITQALRPVVDRLPYLSPEERGNLRLEDVRGFNSMHVGHIQRLYSEQVRARVYDIHCMSVFCMLVCVCACSCVRG